MKDVLRALRVKVEISRLAVLGLISEASTDQENGLFTIAETLREVQTALVELDG